MVRKFVHVLDKSITSYFLFIFLFSFNLGLPTGTLHWLFPGDSVPMSVIQCEQCTCHEYICRSRTLSVDHLSLGQNVRGLALFLVALLQGCDSSRILCCRA